MSDSIIDRRYSDEQVEGLIRAYESPRLTGPQVVALAAAGELSGPDGRPLPPFEIKTASLRSIVRRHRERLAVHHGDLQATNERLIRDLLRVAAIELRAIKAKPAGKRDMQRVQRLVTIHARIGQVLRESEDVRPAAPPIASAPASAAAGMGSLMLAHHRATNGEVA